MNHDEYQIPSSFSTQPKMEITQTTFEEVTNISPYYFLRQREIKIQLLLHF